MATLLKKPKAPPAPKVVPIADEDALQKRKRASVAGQQGRTGRQSTILSSGDTLG